MTSVKATAVEFLDETAPVGGFTVREEPDGRLTFCYVCPCGCDNWRCLPITTGQKVEHAWLWNGDRTLPTLQPSIRHLGQCKFHGFITAGAWTFCGDSGS